MADTLLPGDGTSAAAEEVRNVATPEMHSLLLDLVGASADANVVYGTHGAACSITCGRYLSRWRQGDHVVVRDGCPAHRTLDERAAAGDQVPAVCQAGYACMQLAKNDTEGYCTKCATTQVCTVGTLVFGAEKNMLAWNKCPPGHRCYNSGVDHQYAIGPDDTVADLSLQLQKMRDMDEAELLSEFVRPCPTGTMCYDNEAADCGEAARMPLRVGWTDVHAGSYCPEASPGLEFCPPGFFCRDTKTKLPCPQGFYCPLKTKEPVIRCWGCPEGAETIPRLYLPLLIVVSLMTAAFLGRLVYHSKKKKPSDSGQKSALEPERSSATFSSRRQSAYQTFVRGNVAAAFDHKKFTPTDIFHRCGGNADEHESRITFARLNEVLQLARPKLEYLQRITNHHSGLPLDTEMITYDKFIVHFEVCLNMAANFDPSQSETEEIFNAIDLDGNGVVEDWELHHSATNDFLTSHQVQEMIKKFRKRNPQLGKKVEIKKENFVKYYHHIVNEVMMDSTCHPEVPGVDIAFRELHLTVHGTGKKILTDITGRIRARTMNALMGGSGAGKTSLLNVLCGRAFYGDVAGAIFINGVEGQIQDIMHCVGFVPQDDIVYGELTVKENFLYAGRFRLPASTSEEDINELADEIIGNLGLSRVRNNLVGDVVRRGVSGGEKKRVNIGLELMSKPKVLFLDEPTSGLDSASSSLVMNSLRNLVESGVTVASVIHQPRKFIFDLFDNIVLLGGGGRVVYQGPPDEVIEYFTSKGYAMIPKGENTADWMVDISTGRLSPEKVFSEDTSFLVEKRKFFSSRRVGNEDDAHRNRGDLFRKFREYFEALSAEKRADLVPPHPYAAPEKIEKASFLAQLRYQISRNFLVISRNIPAKTTDTLLIVGAIILLASIAEPTYLHVIPDTPFLGVPLNQIYPDGSSLPVGSPFRILSDVSTLPVSQMFAPFTTAMRWITGDIVQIGLITSVTVSLAALFTMSDKRLEFLRECSSGYDMDAYFIAVNVSGTLEQSLQMVLAGFVNACLRNPVSSWFAFVGNFVMLGWVCSSWALLFCVIVPEKNLVIVTALFHALNGLLLGGGLSPFIFIRIYESSFLNFISGFFAPARYFMESLLVSEFKCLPDQTGFTQTQEATDFPQEFQSFLYAVPEHWIKILETKPVADGFGPGRQCLPSD
eukprot:CAMPEP_0194313112 /NCGR_PEP_ID=MMETSP0171-20130528/10006_1 /TAXON_ID=218684 /ORGANISM="Corethron pennatum, Strain L29A3" /LENGTH=1166 /DNA_ID=CAMNT_0039067921 /DNA_START=59 /DNA_END=3560 /DNA_ORIENTATION=+